MGRGLQLASGQVISLGRLMLASMFLLGIWLELGHPQEATFKTFVLAIAYLFFAASIAIATWGNWWADARLAGPAHTLDIAMFTLMVLLTEGFTSPFFTFFMFLLLSAAIRWGWRATALTALLVAVLYVLAGFLVVRAVEAFDLQRFVIRTGHLIILSLILIWFGINQWRTRFSAREPLAQLAPEDVPAEASLKAAMAAMRATAGAFVWREDAGGKAEAGELRDGLLTQVNLGDSGAPAITEPFLYDLERDRGMVRDAGRSLVEIAPRDVIGGGAADALSLSEGLAIPARWAAGEGMLFVEGIPNLSIDHLDLGDQIAAHIASHMQRNALLKAAEDSAAARSRLSLARDLHDSVVQFLAGAAFRLEAIRRDEAMGAKVGPELDELKQLMLQEQGELRSFVAALRSGSETALNDLARDLRMLADRLAKQWSVECAFSADAAELMIPSQVHLDVQQLVREAVANAVRHAGAKSISIRLVAAADGLHLDFINDGKAYPKSADGGRMPRSLRERVEDAGGAIELSRGMGVTKLSIGLPIAGRH
jgi:signal transduction histidine kinase